MNRNDLELKIFGYIDPMGRDPDSYGAQILDMAEKLVALEIDPVPIFKPVVDRMRQVQGEYLQMIIEAE